jgi:hypothetical protein
MGGEAGTDVLPGTNLTFLSVSRLHNVPRNRGFSLSSSIHSFTFHPTISHALALLFSDTTQHQTVG